MDGTRMQVLAYRGYAIAAAKVGLPFLQYRPLALTAAIVPANALATLPATFTADNYAYRRPSGYGKPTWTVLVDGRLTQPGDYLVEVAALPGQVPRVFFLADQQPILPIVAVECNDTISISRPDPPATPGSGGLKGYGGDVTETTFLTDWPASVLEKGRGQPASAALPDDTKMPGYSVLIPNTPGFRIQTDDFIETGSGLRLEISTVELSSLGWRLSAGLSMT